MRLGSVSNRQPAGANQQPLDHLLERPVVNVEYLPTFAALGRKTGQQNFSARSELAQPDRQCKSSARQVIGRIEIREIVSQIQLTSRDAAERAGWSDLLHRTRPDAHDPE